MKNKKREAMMIAAATAALAGYGNYRKCRR